MCQLYYATDYLIFVAKSRETEIIFDLICVVNVSLCNDWVVCNVHKTKDIFIFNKG